MTDRWYAPENENTVASPALLVYPDRIAANLDLMIATVGGDPTRLRPHIKTTKTPGIVRMQLERGIGKAKCATIAEAEMAARVGVPDLLLANQPVGPAVERLFALVAAFPETGFRTIVDDPGAARILAAAATAAGTPIDVLLDLDVGQHRTGIAPGDAAFDLCQLIDSLPGLSFAGLHAYDGHLRDPDLEVRASAAMAGVREVEALRDRLAAAGIPVSLMIAGGTPSFPVHARREGVECSPGTCVLWDAGYDNGLPEMEFLNAAVLLTRVVSRPSPGRLCLDLGHKAVASENPHPRVIFFDLPDARAVVHSEEHLVVETSRADDFPVGSVLYGIPWHICPTVALYASLQVVRDRRVIETWEVTARARRLEY